MGSFNINNIPHNLTERIQWSIDGIKVLFGRTASSGSSGGGVTIGDPVSGGTTNRVLYGDSSNNIAESVYLQFDGTTLTAKAVTINNAFILVNTDIDITGSSGTKIGTTASQKLAFYGSAPVVQPTGSVITALGNLGLIATPTIGLTEITPGTSDNLASIITNETGSGPGGLLVFSSNPTLSGFTMADTTNIVFNGNTGSRLGTATSQKFAFWNNAPITQPSGSIITALGTASGLGLIASPTIDYSELSGTFAGPLTTKGDLIYESSGTTAVRLPIGLANQVLTVSNGVPTWVSTPNIRASARATGQVAANASVATYTLGINDGSFMVSTNVLVTASGGEAFSVQCTYTDEGGTSRILTMPLVLLAGTVTGAIAFANGAVPYEGVAVQIRCKGSTAITIKTPSGGTYTSCTYNVEGTIEQIS